MEQKIKDRIEAEAARMYQGPNAVTYQMMAAGFLTMGAEIALEEIPKWVSVDERMPELHRSVFVSVQDGKCRYRTLAMWVPKYTLNTDDYDYEGDPEYHESADRYYWPEGWYETLSEADVNYNLSGKVTHWMPLPSPPTVTS